MADTITATAQDYLEALAEELAISDTRYEQAETSYESLGEWLGRPASTIAGYEPAVYVQGSFGLGTVIKPLHEKEEYDIDAICEFQFLEKDELTQAELKELLRAELESYRVARKMEKPLEEGRRCWTMRYAESAQFHMDVVPALIDSDTMRIVLEARLGDTSAAETAIAITDNLRTNYDVLSPDWPNSNPKGYLKWFRARMAPILQKRKKELAEAVQASVESIPDYRVRTPLQSAIMILKRHRDIMYVKDEINACPISIIITTLAAHAYDGEEKIADALVSILAGMESYIGIDENGDDFIANPTDPRENFADKWVDHPERREAFYEWLAQAQNDFRTAASLGERGLIRETLEKHIGSDLAKRAETRSANRGGGGLLRAAAAASAGAVPSAPSFGDVPRTPTTPKGFA